MNNLRYIPLSKFSRLNFGNSPGHRPEITLDAPKRTLISKTSNFPKSLDREIQSLGFKPQEGNSEMIPAPKTHDQEYTLQLEKGVLPQLNLRASYHPDQGVSLFCYTSPYNSSLKFHTSQPIEMERMKPTIEANLARLRHLNSLPAGINQ